MKPLTILLLFLLSFVIRHSSFAAPRPNLVFILLDNVGQEWFGCYGSLEKATPQIDKLAAGGVRFEHCWATPYCSTSRALLLTGRYPHSTGWRFHHDAGIYGGGNFDWKREVTFARALRDAGYATCVAGKWQINNSHEPVQADCLREHGFDEYLVTPGGKEDSKYWDPLMIENGKTSMRTEAYGPDLCTDFVIDFMRRNKDAPFLVYFPITLVHTPLPATTACSSRR
jgi:arylsulfatase A-like enzyme